MGGGGGGGAQGLDIGGGARFRIWGGKVWILGAKV